MSTPIFNSLGSNYSLEFVETALVQLVDPDKEATVKLRTLLAEEFGGTAELFYKGRDAIEYVLRSYGIGEGDAVITQAFTCYALEEAIKRVGAKPVFADLDSETLNPSLETLKQANASASQVKAVIIQHTLGHPAAIEAIHKWCRHQKLVLIEDLAQAIGGVSQSGKPLGSFGDAVVLSFGRDKIVDAVTGGAAIIKTQPTQSFPFNQPEVGWWALTVDLLYPVITWFIRQTYNLGIGKIVHHLVTRSGLLYSPIKTRTPHLAAMPTGIASLVIKQLSQLSEELTQRQKVAQVYHQHLKSSQLEIKTTSSTIKHGPNQRFVVTVDKPQELIRFLAKHQIFLSDRWYRQAVDVGNVGYVSSYVPGSCPVAEQLAQSVINLPTHRQLQKPQVQRLVNTLNAWRRS